MLMNNNTQLALQKGVEILKSGGVVIFPTDTAFGIGCRIDSEDAIQRLFTIKNRDLSQAVPVLVNGFEMAQTLLKPIPQDVYEKLIKPFWPGGLTIILPCLTEKVSPLLRGNGETLGVRSPNHPIAQELISGVGVPIIGTSANLHGHKTPFVISDLENELVNKVDYVVPGESYGQKASTIVDCSVTPWKIVREGAIKLSI